MKLKFLCLSVLFISAFSSLSQAQVFNCTAKEGLAVQQPIILSYNTEGVTALGMAKPGYCELKDGTCDTSSTVTTMTSNGQLAILLSRPLNEHTVLFTQLNVPKNMMQLKQFDMARRNLLRMPRDLTKPLSKIQRDQLVDAMTCSLAESI